MIARPRRPRVETGAILRHAPKQASAAVRWVRRMFLAPFGRWQMGYGPGRFAWLALLTDAQVSPLTLPHALTLFLGSRPRTSSARLAS